MPRDTHHCNSVKDPSVSGNVIWEMEERHYYSSLLHSGKQPSRKLLNRARQRSFWFWMCSHTHAKTPEWVTVPINYVKWGRSTTNKWRIFVFLYKHFLVCNLNTIGLHFWHEQGLVVKLGWHQIWVTCSKFESRLLSTLSSQILSISKGRDSTTSLSNLRSHMVLKKKEERGEGVCTGSEFLLCISFVCCLLSDHCEPLRRLWLHLLCTLPSGSCRRKKPFSP